MGERATEKYKRDQYRSAWVCLNKAKAHNKQWQGKERSSPTHSSAQKKRDLWRESAGDVIHETRARAGDVATHPLKLLKQNALMKAPPDSFNGV